MKSSIIVITRKISFILGIENEISSTGDPYFEPSVHPGIWIFTKAAKLGEIITFLSLFGITKRTREELIHYAE